MRHISTVKPLTGDKLGKKAVLFDKLLVSAVLNDLSFIEDYDPVALLYG